MNATFGTFIDFRLATVMLIGQNILKPVRETMRPKESAQALKMCRMIAAQMLQEVKGVRKVSPMLGASSTSSPMEKDPTKANSQEPVRQTPS